MYVESLAGPPFDSVGANTSLGGLSMTMTASAYASLVARVEQSAASQPRAYRLRLLALAGLGYGYIALVLAILIALVVGLTLVSASPGTDPSMSWGSLARRLLFLLVIPVGVMIYYVLRGLFARGHAPEGRELTRELAPALFAVIDEARAATDAQPIDRVVLNAEFNASIHQESRLGLLGWSRNHLVLGLPLLDALPPDEVRSILAHELGHVQGRRMQLASQIFRVHTTWHSLLDGMAEVHPTARLLFLPFFCRYVPYFSAYASVLVRAHELAADRAASGLVSPRSLADALTRLELVGADLASEFWPGVYERAKASPLAPDAVFSELVASVRAGPVDDKHAARLDAILRRETDDGDSHPCLRDRLAALEQAPRLPAPGAVSAAEVLLGEALPSLRDELNQTWHAEAGAWWQEQYDDARERSGALLELEQEAARRTLTIREQWRHARLVESVRGEAVALPIYQELAHARPRDAKAHFQVGRLLLIRGDVAGIESIETAVRIDPWLAEPALEVVTAHLDARAWPSEYTLCTRSLEGVNRTLEEARGDAFSEDQPLLAHDLTAEALQPLIDLIDSCEDVEAAHLVRQAWPAFPDVMLYRLALTVATAARRDEQEVAVLAAWDQFHEAPEAPAATFFAVYADPRDQGLQRVAQVPGSAIYQRDQGSGRRAA